MITKNIFKTLVVAGMVTFSSTSCTDWLDVTMSDKIMENSLYSTNNGFMIALNGVYMGMIDVYGEDLSMGVIDVMAQYYNMVNGNHYYKVYAEYQYDEADFKNKSNTIWTKMYELIANTNVLLNHCDEEGSALREDYYPIIKGEALALRGMMHFDLLRMYGPVYSESTASTVTIPYQDDASREIKLLLPAKEVLAKVIKDLEDASALLKETDPIFTTGVGNAVTSDDGLERADFTYRQLRLNYFAVQTLLARAYLWRGTPEDKEKAYSIVTEEVIAKNQKEEDEMIFPWTTREQVEAKDKGDLLFSPEVFFAIYHSSRSSLYSRYFSQALQTTSRLTFVGTSPANSQITVFYDDPSNDWRATNAWDVVSVAGNTGGDDDEEDDDEDEPVDSGSSLFFLKYGDPGTEAELDGTETYFKMIPLIRLSEAYIIAAECAPTIEESLKYLVEIRSHRNCHMAIEAHSADDLRALITKEFAREVIGEGQLFFYYKRLNMDKFLNGSIIGGEYEMVSGNYVWPLPDVEVEKRGSSNK